MTPSEVAAKEGRSFWSPSDKTDAVFSALSPLTLTRLDGAEVPLAEAWNGQAAVVLYIRRLG